ncbi:MAG: hypothetical protein IJ829_02145, partial [Kiritimatiellae bacterium]|nr:hypothetical protein [Kiritimatiellia bacterium]
MRHALTALCLVFAARASALARLSVAPLPGPVRPLAEVETNVVISAPRAADDLWRIAIEFAP